MIRLGVLVFTERLRGFGIAALEIGLNLFPLKRGAVLFGPIPVSLGIIFVSARLVHVLGGSWLQGFVLGALVLYVTELLMRYQISVPFVLNPDYEDPVRFAALLQRTVRLPTIEPKRNNVSVVAGPLQFSRSTFLYVRVESPRAPRPKPL